MVDITIHQLKCFIVLADCLNFTEAGKKLYISQTAVTQQIRSLEDKVGASLFNRNKKRVELTPAGKVFYTEAKAILERTHSALAKTKKADTGMIGRLNIGYVKGYENTNFGSILNEFHEQYPNIVFGLYRNAHLDLMLHLREKKLDLALNICYSDTNIEGLNSMQITSVPLYAVLHPGHAYAQLSSINRFDLRHEPFIMTEFADDILAKTNYIPEQFVSSGFFPNIVAKSSDFETILLLVACGVGISILPASSIRYVKQSNSLVFVPLSGEHEHIDVMAFWNKENDNPTIPKFLEILKERPWTPSTS